MKFLKLLLLTITQVSAIIKGINFYGLETPGKDFVCGWKHRPDYYLAELNKLGFNRIRLPFSLEYIQGNDFSKMDEFMNAISIYPHMTVMLDMHRVFSSHQGPTPTEDWVTMDIFLNGWKTILQRYQHNKQVVVVDIFNEYQGQDANYWNGVARTIVTFIENNFPKRFNYSVGGINWGGNIHDINLEDLPFSKRIVYTIHKYIFSSFGDRVSDWDWSLGPFKDVPNKISIGEWGFIDYKGDQVEWAQQFVSYLLKHKIHNNFFWTLSLSGDTDGLWRDDCETFIPLKYQVIQRLWSNHTS